MHTRTNQYEKCSLNCFVRPDHHSKTQASEQALKEETSVSWATEIWMVPMATGSRMTRVAKLDSYQRQKMFFRHMTKSMTCGTLNTSRAQDCAEDPPKARAKERAAAEEGGSTHEEKEKERDLIPI